MGYIGNNLQQQVTQPATQFFSGNGSTTSFTLNQTPQSVYTVEVIVNNVQQNPQTSYYLNGNSLIFYSAPPSGSSNIYVNYNPIIAYASLPGYGTVGQNQLGNISNINSIGPDLTLQTNSITGITISSSTRNVSIAGAVNIAGTLTYLGTLTTTGSILPSGSNLYDLGSPATSWRNIYTGDLHLSNESRSGNDIDGTTGNWTIQEGEEHLYLINNKTGKKYRFKLEEL